MRMFWFEWKKILKNSIIIVMIVLFVFFDIYKIAMLHEQENVDISGHEELYSELKGKLTIDKIRFVTENYKSYRQIVEAGNYSKEPNQEGTYTGYIYGDYTEFETFFQEYKYIYEYEITAKKVLDKATNNCLLFPDDDYEQRLNASIQESFAHRYLDSYYDMKGLQKWLEYDFSSFFLVVLLLLLVPTIVQQEYSSGMRAIINTTEQGYRHYCTSRILAILLWSFLMLLLFRAIDFFVFQYFYPMKGLLQPIYSIKEYSFSIFNGSIIEFALTLSCLQYLGLCFWAMLILFVMEATQKTILAIGTASSMFAIMVFVLMNSRCMINPLLLFVSYHMFVERTIIRIGNYPVDVAFINAVFFIYVGVIMHYLVLVLNKKRLNKKYAREKF